jgi:hypothetical protein
MASYFQENRFRTVAESIGHASDIFYGQSLAKAPSGTIDFSQHYEVNYGDAGGAVIPKEPSVEYNDFAGTAGAVELINKVGEWYKEYRENSATKAITDQIAGQIPFGEKVKVTITDPGEESERIFVEAGDPGPAMYATNTDKTETTVYGRDFQTSGMPSQVSFTDSSGHQETVPVAQRPQPVATQAPAKPNNYVNREPGGIREAGPPEPLRADSRGDRDYPGYRDPGGLA